MIQEIPYKYDPAYKIKSRNSQTIFCIMNTIK